VPLRVPDAYEDRFEALRDYIEGEMKMLEDDDLEQELELLERLLESSE